MTTESMRSRFGRMFFKRLHQAIEAQNWKDSPELPPTSNVPFENAMDFYDSLVSFIESESARKVAEREAELVDKIRERKELMERMYYSAQSDVERNEKGGAMDELSDVISLITSQKP